MIETESRLPGQDETIERQTARIRQQQSFWISRADLLAGHAGDRLAAAQPDQLHAAQTRTVMLDGHLDPESREAGRQAAQIVADPAGTHKHIRIGLLIVDRIAKFGRIHKMRRNLGDGITNYDRVGEHRQGQIRSGKDQPFRDIRVIDIPNDPCRAGRARLARSAVRDTQRSARSDASCAAGAWGLTVSAVPAVAAAGLVRAGTAARHPGDPSDRSRVSTVTANTSGLFVKLIAAVGPITAFAALGIACAAVTAGIGAVAQPTAAITACGARCAARAAVPRADRAVAAMPAGGMRRALHPNLQP